MRHKKSSYRHSARHEIFFICMNIHYSVFHIRNISYGVENILLLFFIFTSHTFISFRFKNTIWYPKVVSVLYWVNVIVEFRIRREHFVHNGYDTAGTYICLELGWSLVLEMQHLVLFKSYRQLYNNLLTNQ